MVEEETLPTDYEALSEEFRKVAGPLDASLQYIQDGIEMEAFRETRPGKVLIGRAMRAMHSAIDMILDPNVAGQELSNAVFDLRVQHRVLNAIAETVSEGRKVISRINREDAEAQENPDEQSL